jgi:hypothetical protein
LPNNKTIGLSGNSNSERETLDDVCSRPTI